MRRMPSWAGGVWIGASCVGLRVTLVEEDSKRNTPGIGLFGNLVICIGFHWKWKGRLFKTVFQSPSLNGGFLLA